MVGARGFEPPTPCSQSRCATRLRHAPSPRRRCCSGRSAHCTRPAPKRPDSEPSPRNSASVRSRSLPDRRIRRRQHTFPRLPTDLVCSVGFLGLHSAASSAELTWPGDVLAGGPVPRASVRGRDRRRFSLCRTAPPTPAADSSGSGSRTSPSRSREGSDTDLGGLGPVAASCRRTAASG